MTSYAKFKNEWLGGYDLVLIVASVVALIATLTFNVALSLPHSSFFDLGLQMLRGHLYLPDVWQNVKDTAPFQGHPYWPLGPFPVLLYILMILVTGSQVDVFMSDSIMTVGLTLVIVYVMKRIARGIGFTANDSHWLAFVYVFASPLLAIVWAPRANYVAHLIIALVLPAAYLAYENKRFGSVGWMYAVAVATRVTALPTMGAYMLMTLWQARKRPLNAVRAMLWMCGPVILAVIALMVYNHVRFHDPLEFGYELQLLNTDLATMRAVGTMSILHIPGNLYYYFFAAPILYTNPGNELARFPYLFYSWWGVGMLFTSPYLLTLCWQKLRDRLDVFMLIFAGLSAIPIFCYYGIGAFQLGYRYGIDFFPLLFIVFMRSLYMTEKKIPTRFKVLFLSIFMLNAYLFFVNHFVMPWLW